MLLYLDLNCFNRPFDDQGQDRIAQETAASFVILQWIIGGVDRLVWSAILTFENAQHPLADRRIEIARWAQRAVVHVAVTQQVAARARTLTRAGFRPLDAAHLACAEAAACDRFLTAMIESSGERDGSKSDLACKILETMYRSIRMSEQLTDDALYAKGLAVLEDHLGPVHTLRFLALMSRQSFDYQRWRQQHFGAMSL